MERYFKVARKTANGKVVTEKKDGKDIEVLWGDDSLLPVYSTKQAAGADLKCAEDVVVPSILTAFAETLVYTGKGIFNFVDQCTKSKGVNVEQLKMLLEKGKETFKPTLVHTGVKLHLPDDEVALVYNRSGNPIKFGLVVANGVGVIDADYYESAQTDGEIMVQFYNFMPFNINLKKGDRIAQVVIQKYLRAENIECKDTVRADGHGHTGK